MTIPMDIVFVIIPIINYWLAHRFVFFQIHFSEIQLVVFHVMLLELSINGNTPYLYSLIFKELPIIILCLINYNQFLFNLLQVVCYAYNIGRSKTLYADLYLYSMFIIEYFFFVFICMVIGRINNRKERDAFLNL
jgi:hypothetical protein